MDLRTTQVPFSGLRQELSQGFSFLWEGTCQKVNWSPQVGPSSRGWRGLGVRMSVSWCPGWVSGSSGGSWESWRHWKMACSSPAPPSAGLLPVTLVSYKHISCWNHSKTELCTKVTWAQQRPGHSMQEPGQKAAWSTLGSHGIPRGSFGSQGTHPCSLGLTAPPVSCVSSLLLLHTI